MSILQDLRTRGRHRGKTPWQLVQTIGRLERDADRLTCQIVELATENDELRADRNRIEGEREQEAIAYQAAVDELTEERDALHYEVRRMRDRFGPQMAAEANATRVTVPPMVRDTSALEDQATEPQGIDVRSLWAAAEAGLLRAVTDPGRIGPDDDTQPLPAA